MFLKTKRLSISQFDWLFLSVYLHDCMMTLFYETGKIPRGFKLIGKKALNIASENFIHILNET